MHHYRQALLRMRQGDSDRDIAAARVMGRPKAAQWRRIAAHSDGYSPRCSCTILTARSRTSGEKLFDLFIAPSVAVGTRITPRPPHRSVRAALPHTAPALSHDAKRSLGYG